MRHGVCKPVLAGLLVLISIGLQSCVSTGSDFTDAKEASRANTQLALQALSKDDLKNARDLINKALAQDKKNASAHIANARLQHRIKKPDEAKKSFDRAIRLEPEEAEHRNTYGVFLCQIKEYTAAEKQFNLAADNAFYKTPYFALDNAGVCMLDANKIAKAETYLRKALTMEPQFANTYLHMAELLFRQGRKTVAEAYFQQYMTNGRATPESLLLGIQIKRDLNKSAEAEEYASRLLNDFPESSEAGEYLAPPTK